MIDDGFRVLDAIQRDEVATLAASEDWIAAFRTVKWVAKTDTGICLTAAGREAHSAMARDRMARPGAT